MDVDACTRIHLSFFDSFTFTFLPFLSTDCTAIAFATVSYLGLFLVMFAYPEVLHAECSMKMEIILGFGLSGVVSSSQEDMGYIQPEGKKGIHGHRTLKTPHPVRSAKLTRVPPS